MKGSVPALRNQFILLAFLVSLLWTSVGYAQQPPPSPAASPSPAPSVQSSPAPSAQSSPASSAQSSPAPSAQASTAPKAPADYKAYPLDKPLPPASAPATEATAAAPAASAKAAASTAASQPNTISTAPSEPINAAPNAIVQPYAQGVITLDVSTPDTIRAGDVIDYTYAYANASSVTATDIEIQAVWANFTPWPDRGKWQWCEPSIPNCGFLPDSVQGPATVTPQGSPDAVNGMRFKIGALAPGQRGQFTVRLRSNTLIFPQSNWQIVRPSGSAKLFTSMAGGKGTIEPTSDDTANTMVVGPAFVLSKTPVNTQPIYPTEIAEFVIRVGNATGTGDKINNQVRADAIDATNVVLTDVIPEGSEFVEATPAPARVETSSVTWNFATLAVESTQEVHVKFRKLNVNAGCRAVVNNQYTVTSAEMPSDGNGPFRIYGPGTSVGVVTPVVIKEIIATPWDKVYGGDADLKITVQNFWNQPITGVQLHYDIQTNAYYIPASASPTPSARPDGTQLGGRVSWTFDMLAGSKTTPTEKTFTLRVKGAYTSVAEKGIAVLAVPTSVPSACSQPFYGRVNFIPRLVVTKRAELTSDKLVGGVYRVKRGDHVTYTVEVSNNGVANATNVTVRDLLPNQTDANFSYVPGSATMGDGSKREPSVITNGKGGTLVWTGVTVPVLGKISFRYDMVVDGRDFYDYCNLVRAESGNEWIEYRGDNVCVKITPNIDIVKTTAQQGPVQPNGTVEFTLTLTNYEQVPYTVGLYDRMGAFTFVEQKSGYAQPERVAGSNDLRWPLVEVPPAGQISATIVARVPDVCQNTGYGNEALFYNPNDIIRKIPPAYVEIRVVCNVLEYELALDRSPVSLQDRVLYTVVLRNLNPNDAISNVSVDTLLPQGFTWVGLEGSSGVLTLPQQTTRAGQTMLTWNVPSIDKGSVKLIRFFARSGNTVGLQEARMTATAPNALLRCTGDCSTYNDDGTSRMFSRRSVEVSPLITIAPEIIPNACVKPGDKVTYRLQIVNTNSHSYTGTTVRTTLPLGLTYVRTLGTTPAPITSTNADGVTQVAWFNLLVPSKPGNAVAAQVTLEIEVQVGQVWGELVTVEQATSPDGAIPRKDGTQNVSVLVCPTQPAIAKAASQTAVKYGNTAVYQISLANPTASEMQVTVEDTLPDGLAFVGMVNGPAPTVTDNTLRWQVTLPAAKDGKPGAVQLQMRVRVLPTAPQAPLHNVAQVTHSIPTTDFDTRYNAVDIVPFGNVYIPLARR